MWLVFNNKFSIQFGWYKGNYILFGFNHKIKSRQVAHLLFGKRQLYRFDISYKQLFFRWNKRLLVLNTALQEASYLVASR